jgi:(p)ppGpp synthase/HD superfamily hydrolase
MNDVIARAAEYARAAHASINQRRKYTKEPYIVHPEAVANIVAEVSDDAATIVAAWLHDVVEDTPITIEQIEAEFGADIAGLVADLTDVSNKSDGNRARRKAIDRDHTALADPRAKTVKLADVIHNLGDIVSLAPDFAPVYLEEKEHLLEVLTEGHPVLFQRARQIIDDSKNQIAGRGSP